MKTVKRASAKPQPVPPISPSQPAPPDATDILIVGAGVAGLYCAYRLLQKNPNQKIAVVDRLGRTGGRLQTDHIFIKDVNGKPVEAKDEEGGMRFNFSMQEVITLSYELGLCDEIVPFGDGGPNNRICVRGRSFTNADAAANNGAIWSELYNLKENEKGQGPGGLLGLAFKYLLAINNTPTGTDTTTPEFWQKFRLEYEYKGKKLNEWGTWAFLRDYGFSEEAMQMFLDTVGFEGPFLSSVSLGEAFQILEDFPENPKYYAYRQGFSTLPNALVKKIKEGKNASISLGVTIESLDKTKEGYVATWSTTPGVFPKGHHAKEAGKVSFNKVILALPKKALKNLTANSPLLNATYNTNYAQFAKNLNGVLDMKLLKINLYYNQAWWEEDGLTGQPPVMNWGSFTDLPLGSAYVFNPVYPQDVDGPAALTIYCDFNRTTYWETLQAIGPMFSSALQKEHDNDVPQTIYPASEAVVEAATEQLKILFKTNNVLPRPLLTSFRYWDGEDDFGYAYHQWGRFVNDREVIAGLVNPVKDVYTCNESWSDMQGWVNGSLRSSELVLTKHFHTPPLVPDPKIWGSPCGVPDDGEDD
ncbi:MAG: FAD-dependent oxidoreductase [Saprospiraceae bacterium]